MTDAEKKEFQMNNLKNLIVDMAVKFDEADVKTATMGEGVEKEQQKLRDKALREKFENLLKQNSVTLKKI